MLCSMHANGIMSLTCEEDIKVAYAALEEEEKIVNQKLETHLSKQYQLQAKLKNITKNIPKLHNLSVDADKLCELINKTATLADSVSEKVRRLDTIRTRVSDCQQRVHDLLDLQLCSEGVQAALREEDYEKAAAHVHRFLSIDQQLLRQTADQIAEDQLNVSNSFNLLQDVTNDLRVVVAKKFNEAIQLEDFASVERFFKIYPLLNLHEEGIKKYASYLSRKLRETALKNLKTAVETARYDRKPNVIFADTLTSLLEGTARYVETCQPLVDTYYGRQHIVLFIEELQSVCDSESKNLFDEFIRQRQLEKITRQVNDYESNVKSTAKPDSKPIDFLINELISMLSKIDLYFKFLRRRVLTGVYEKDYERLLAEITQLINNSGLNRKLHESLGYYVLLEKYFMEESVRKALTLDPNDVNASQMADDVFFIVRKAIRRACSGNNLEGVCTVINHVCTLLDTEYASVIKQQLRQGYPSGYLDLTQAYNALQHGRLQTSDPEQTKLSFIAFLNCADLSQEYLDNLKESVKEDIARTFPRISVKEKAKADMCLSGLSSVATSLSVCVDYGMKQLKESAIKPRVNPWINTFLDYPHELSEEEFDHQDSSDGFASNLIKNIDGLLNSFRDTLSDNNYDALVHVLTAEVAAQLEKNIFKVKFNRLGGLLFDREIRLLISFLTGATSWSVREKFARLTNIATLLNLERVADILEADDDLKKHLQVAEVKKVLRRRVDFSSEDIDNVKISV